MSTRGVYGFRKDGSEKITYNHSGSEPEFVGMCILEFIQQTTDEEMDTIFGQIILVNEDDVPSKEEIKECKSYFKPSERKPRDWYRLLNDLQGNLLIYKKGFKYMTDKRDFLKDTTFCEWGYILDLDKRQLEVFFFGFLLKSFPFAELREMDTAEAKEWAESLLSSTYECE